MYRGFFLFGVGTALLGRLAVGAAYTSPSGGFSLDYDEANWEVVKGPTAAKQDVDEKMAERTLVTLQRKNADEKYRTRFSVVEDDASHYTQPGLERLVAYNQHAVDFLKSQRFRILSTAPRTLPKVGEPGVETVANQRDFGLTFRQVVFLRGKNAYLLTAATRTNRFETYGKEIQALFESFHFKGPKGK
jgi:hypothetical protein